MRVVFDTNIYVSALVFPGGSAGEAMLRIIDGRDTLLVSREILDELLSTLSRKFSRDAEQLSRVAVNISEITEAVTVKKEKRLNVLKDSPDNRILECAIEGRADLIITGDKEMLRLKSYGGVRIISLRQYVEGI